jgi:hypothetical protein
VVARLEPDADELLSFATIVGVSECVGTIELVTVGPLGGDAVPITGASCGNGCVVRYVASCERIRGSGVEDRSAVDRLLIPARCVR